MCVCVSECLVYCPQTPLWNGGYVTADIIVRGARPDARERPGVQYYRIPQRRPTSGELKGPEQK